MAHIYGLYWRIEKAVGGFLCRGLFRAGSDSVGAVEVVVDGGTGVAFQCNLGTVDRIKGRCSRNLAYGDAMPCVAKVLSE